MRGERLEVRDRPTACRSPYGLKIAPCGAVDRAKALKTTASIGDTKISITASNVGEAFMGAPRTSRVSGESGGTSRLNVAYNIHCDLVAEREV